MSDIIQGWTHPNGEYRCTTHTPNPVGCYAVFYPKRVCPECLPAPMQTVSMIKSITRISEKFFSVTTGTVLSDGSLKMDGQCILEGNILRSFESKGLIRVGGLISVALGPKSLPKVQSLAVGQTIEF